MSIVEGKQSETFSDNKINNYKRKRQTRMDSKDIIKNYLDVELGDVVLEKDAVKIILKESQGELSQSEAKLLYSLIQKNHQETSMNRVLKNLDNAEFNSVWDDRDNLRTADENDIGTAEISDIISKLQSINHNLELNIHEIQQTKNDLKSKLTLNINLLRKMIRNKTENGDSDNEETQNLIEIINAYICKMITE